MILLDPTENAFIVPLYLMLKQLGLSPRLGDRIIEIGAVALNGETIVDEFHSLICVDQPINPAAQRIHRIYKTDAFRAASSQRSNDRNSTPLSEIASWWHIMRSFDMRFVGSEFARLKLDFRKPAFAR